MTVIPVFDKKNVKLSTSGLNLVEPPSLYFGVSVDLPEDAAKATKVDKLLMRQFTEAAEAIMKQTAEMIEKKCLIFEKLFQNMVDQGETWALIERNLAGLNKALQTDVEVARAAADQAVSKVWEALKAKRKEWRNYKMKVIGTIVVTVAKLTFHISTIVLSAGAAAATSGMSVLNGAVKLMSTAYDLYQDIEGARKRLESDLATVEKHAKSNGLYAAAEVTNATLKAFLGVSAASLKSCEKNYDLLKAKLAHMVVICHDIAMDLTKMEAQRTKMDAAFKSDVQKALKGIPVSNAREQEAKILNKYAARFEKSDKSIRETSVAMERLNDDCADWEKKVEALGKRFDALMINDPAGLKIFRVAIAAISMGIGPAINPSATEKTLEKALALAKDAVAFDYGAAVMTAVDATALQGAKA